MQERRKTAVGRIAKSFGLSGELMVSLFDTFPADFDTKEPLFVVIDKLAVPLFCDRFERRGRRSALVVFSDFYSEKRTDELIGCELFLEGEEDAPDGEPLDPDADEFYPEDLVGFGVMVDESAVPAVAGRKVRLRSRRRRVYYRDRRCRAENPDATARRTDRSERLICEARLPRRRNESGGQPFSETGSSGFSGSLCESFLKISRPTHASVAA